MAFRIVRNDITKMTADAIVNTANELVGYGDGVDAAIYAAAGEDELLAARAQIGELKVGELCVTPAFNLDAKYIIHICGNFYDGEDEEATKLLTHCYDSCLIKAKELGCESIAFPLLATGTFGFPREAAIKIALNSFMHFLEENEMEITLVVFDKQSVDTSEKFFSDLMQFIDDNYVEETIDSEYSFGRPEALEYDWEDYKGCASLPDDIEDENLPYDEDDGLPFSSFAEGHAKPADKPLFSHNKLSSIFDVPAPKASRAVTTDSVDSMPAPSPDICVKSLKEPDASDLKNMVDFGYYIQQLINRKGFKSNSEVYIHANWTKQYFSKVMSGQISPAKPKLLSLAIALRLNYDETIDFLRMSGYAFSPCSKTDLVVEYYIRKQIYDLGAVESKLLDLGLQTLSNY